jgi:orotate phosphoribosyltransferase
MELKRKIAKDLLDIRAVYLRPQEPFTWASGIKSPIYCDNRLTLSDVRVRLDVENGLAELVKQHYSQADLFLGTSTAEYPCRHNGASSGFTYGYVRSGAKDHGLGNRIEGRLEKGWKAVVIEDLISTGGSAIDTVQALREAGAEVLGIASIFTYGMKKGLERLAEAKVKNVSLTDFDAVVEAAAECGYIAESDIPMLLRFRDEHSTKAGMRGGKRYEKRFDRYPRPYPRGNRPAYRAGRKHYSRPRGLP